LDGNWVSELAALLNVGAPAEDLVASNGADDVLGFWFDELEPADWFKKSAETDVKIGRRFLNLYRSVGELAAQDLAVTGRQSLAAVITLDQFPRNLFRGHAQSFATDSKARDIAVRAIDNGFDQAMTVNERVFLYLPFEHSEDMADQEKAVALIGALGDENYTSFAVAHRNVIEQFGRFPHRNAAFGRTSTPQELEYLAKPGSGF
jgi:uncharacterized protein (DUF924 family)